MTTNPAPPPSSALTCIAVLSPPPSSGETTTENPNVGAAKTASSASAAATAILRGPVWQCAFSRDGKLLASCHGAPDPCVRMWKRTRRQIIADESGENELNENDGEATEQDEEERWELSATLSGVHDRTVRSVSFAPSAQVLAAASFDGTVSIWEHFPSESKGGEGEWDCTAQLEGHENEVKSVKWNSTGTLLATCGRDKSVWIWECLLPGTIGGDGLGGGGGGEAEFECLAVLHGHDGDVKCVQFVANHGQWGDGDEILLSASYDDTIKCWAEDGGDWYCATTLSSVHTSTIWSLAAAPGGARVVSGSDDQSLAIWKCYTASEKARLWPESGGSRSEGLWKCVGRLPSAHDRSVYSVHCAPSRAGHGRIASAGGDDRINIYREVGGTSDQPLFAMDASAKAAHGDGDVNCICWHPRDGTLLASTGDDGTVRLWRYDIQ